MSEPTIRINFSDEEVASEARLFSAVPQGEYLCSIKDVETLKIKDVDAQGNANKNAGKYYWKVTLVVKDGKYKNTHFFTNVMLFEGAGFSLAQLMRATGNDKALKSGQIPAGKSLKGQEVTAVVAKIVDKFAKKNNPPGEATPYKNEVKGFKTASAASATASAGSNPLAP